MGVHFYVGLCVQWERVVVFIPLYSFYVVYVLFYVWAISLDGTFEMWSHQSTAQRDENLIRQTCRRSSTKFAVSIRPFSNASASWNRLQGDT